MIEQAVYVLWYRRNRSHPWRDVGHGVTELECTELMARMPTGEYLTLPDGKHPNDGTY